MANAHGTTGTGLIFGSEVAGPNLAFERSSSNLFHDPLSSIKQISSRRMPMELQIVNLRVAGSNPAIGSPIRSDVAQIGRAGRFITTLSPKSSRVAQLVE